MTNEPLDELYLGWLYAQVSSLRLKNPTRTYWKLLKQLYQKEFVWLVPNDDNRLEDGRDLRYEFQEEHQFHQIDSDWMSLGCSTLELLVGLSRRLAFEAEGEPRDWFWRMLENLELSSINDAIYDEQYEVAIDEILERLIWRNYSPDGQGGLFPLKHAERDQRQIEIWYQLSAYLLENE